MRSLVAISLLSLAALVSTAAAKPPVSEHARAVRWDEAQRANQQSWNRATFRKEALELLRIPDGDEKISLPSGKMLDMTATFLEEPSTLIENGRFFPENRFVVKFEYDKGDLLSLIAAEKGVIKGPILVFHPGGEGKIAAAAAFTDGTQTGSLLTWTSEEKRAFFGQFRSGRREGYFVLFDKEGKPRVVEEYKRDKMVSADLLKDGKVVESAKPDGSMDFGGPLAGASAELEASYKQIAAAERGMKKALADWDQELRKQQAIANANVGRKEIIARGRANNAGVIAALRKWSNGYDLVPARPAVLSR